MRAIGDAKTWIWTRPARKNSSASVGWDASGPNDQEWRRAPRSPRRLWRGGRRTCSRRARQARARGLAARWGASRTRP